MCVVSPAPAQDNANQATLSPAWSIASLPGATAGVTLSILQRGAIAAPARYRLVVVPGSGCTGWAPLADHYFAGLLHAQLLVLHKPEVSIEAGLASQCSPEFTAQDRLSSWRDHARAALRAHAKHRIESNEPQLPLPTLLIGISEGAEIVPDLAPEVAALAGVVIISAPGLDPHDIGQQQALRLGHLRAWQAIDQARSSVAGDHVLIEGRTLGYWRDLWQWPVATPLLQAPWPLLRVWGEADALVPAAAYEKFARQAGDRAAPFCDVRLSGADHGLQRHQPARGSMASNPDGLRWLWARLENWARNRAPGLCAAVDP